MSATVESTAGVRLALHELDGKGRRPLLVAHATGFHGRAYEPLGRHLSGFHVWAPDLRGHGDSTPPRDGRFHWEGLADDIEAVVEAIAADEPLYGFGHSMGAAVMLLAEARRPDTFRAIYGYEPIVYPPGAPQDPERRDHFVEGTRRRRREFPSFAEAVRNFSAKPPFDAFDRSSLEAYIEHGFERIEDAASEQSRLRIKMDPEHESRMYQMSPEHPTWLHLPEVSRPVLVVTGRVEPHTPAAWAPGIVERLPRGRLHVFPDLGHMGPLEDPARIAAHASEFFASVSP